MGRFLLAYYGCLGPSSVLHAELSTIQEGLHLAWSKGLNRIIVQTDSSDAYELFSPPTVNRLFSHVRSITLLCSRNWLVDFTLIRCEANYAAGHLAKLALKNERLLRVIEAAPDSLTAILHRDLYAPFTFA
ncbi:uncharacterized protein LOC120216517 [Hibiscus syriacus]|uniref:uncharacterized protein LOC120216517 n=1 Tax=Hibiscus syriacus TaxID=106335 RepID=UPI001924D4FD|nr:uncharacterized protein LOC120216517 [Hibiscus syriacus]